MGDKVMRVLMVKPGEFAKEAEIDGSLAGMQETVGGMIEEYMPFDDDVALICNEEGKMLGMDLNRAIYADDGRIMDIIAGPFFICHAPADDDSFKSLPEDMMKKYEEKFKYPEMFYRGPERGIQVVRMMDMTGEKEPEYER